MLACLWNPEDVCGPANDFRQFYKNQLKPDVKAEAAGLKPCRGGRKVSLPLRWYFRAYSFQNTCSQEERIFSQSGWGKQNSPRKYRGFREQLTGGWSGPMESWSCRLSFREGRQSRLTEGSDGAQTASGARRRWASSITYINSPVDGRCDRQNSLWDFCQCRNWLIFGSQKPNWSPEETSTSLLRSDSSCSIMWRAEQPVIPAGRTEGVSSGGLNILQEDSQRSFNCDIHETLEYFNLEGPESLHAQEHWGRTSHVFGLWH